MATVDYPYISVDSDKVPMLTGTNTKVVEGVLDHLAYGLDADDIRHDHAHFAAGTMSVCRAGSAAGT